MYPEDLKYTTEHEWVRPAEATDDTSHLGGADSVRVRVGVTSFAAESLGDIVYVNLPESGTEVTAGQPCGEVESTKSVSDVYAPLTGTVVGRNEALETTPDLINSDPYGEGWMLEMEVGDRAAVEALLDAGAYESGLDPA